MTERGLRSVDSAPACPFVAFEDDREARSTSPDHRHRCYAELVPSPRAAAHQEAYCLSSAFPVCPTFQDWARREAAHARGEGDKPRAAPQAQPESSDQIAASTGEDEDEIADGSKPTGRPARRHELVDEPPIRRNPPRDWAAPPPWASGGPGSGQTGSTRRTSGDESPNPPTFLAGRSDESRGLAGSAADRLVGGASDSEDSASEHGAGSSDAPDDELAGLVTGRRRVERPDAEYLPPARGTRRPTVSSTRNNQRERERERDAIVGPSWERSRRFEAYPTIRSRAGLPALPRLAVLAGALVIAAVALFFLPALLGVGGNDGGSGSTGQPSASEGPATASPSPTAPPEPSAQVYLIKEGDTLSTVAVAFGLTLDELLAANPDFQEHPDEVQIGDEIIIPATPPSEFTDPSAEPS